MLRIIVFISVISTVCANFQSDAELYMNLEEPKLKLLEAQESIKTVNPPLLIGAYNIQTLGRKKLKNTDVMIIVEQVIHRYDLILVTELMTSERKYLTKFLEDVNRFSPEGIVYNMTVNNEPFVDETCVFFYRIDKLKVLKTESYIDQQKFYRTPYIVLFESPTLRDMDRFIAIGLHVKPTQAVQELNALPDVYDYAKRKYNVEDAMLMGDFNADCAYVKENDWTGISLWRRDDFTWPLDNSADTTTNYKKCALDRFVYAGENMNSGVIMSSARVFDFREELNRNIEEARAASDHWPIEIQIRGKMSDTAEKQLSSETCFSVRDAREKNVTMEDIKNTVNQTQFTVKSTQKGIFMQSTTKYFDEMVTTLKEMGNKTHTVVTKEQLEAIIYKSEMGTLNDSSSFADEVSTLYRINIVIIHNYTTVHICKTTTIN